MGPEAFERALKYLYLKKKKKFSSYHRSFVFEMLAQLVTYIKL